MRHNELAGYASCILNFAFVSFFLFPPEPLGRGLVASLRPSKPSWRWSDRVWTVLLQYNVRQFQSYFWKQIIKYIWVTTLPKNKSFKYNNSKRIKSSICIENKQAKVMPMWLFCCLCCCLQHFSYIILVLVVLLFLSLFLFFWVGLQ